LARHRLVAAAVDNVALKNIPPPITPQGEAKYAVTPSGICVIGRESCSAMPQLA